MPSRGSGGIRGGLVKAEALLHGPVDGEGRIAGGAAVLRIEAVNDGPEISAEREKRADPIHAARIVRAAIVQ